MNAYHKEYETGDTTADALISKLVRHIGNENATEAVHDLITSAVKLGLESKDRADLKLANSTLKELRYSFKIFAPFRDHPKVIIFGSARSKPDSPEYKMAVSFAKKMCKTGYMVVTGGGPGVMEAGNRGAPEGMDFALNIRLPFEQHANPYVSQAGMLINYKYFFTRKLFFVKESDATTVFPGGFGTLDEGFEMLTLVQTGKSKPRPIVFMEPEGSTYWHDCMNFINRQLISNQFVSAPDASLYTIAHSADEAVAYIKQFYRIYHSMRYDGKITIIRLRKPLSKKKLARINTDFRDICSTGTFIPSDPTPKEIERNEVLHLPRLVFNFDRRNFSRFYELIHAINAPTY